MRSWTLAAVGLLSTAVEAAPRQVLGDELETRDAGVQFDGMEPRSPLDDAGYQMDGAMGVPAGCPTGTLVVSTTTIDVTVYVTPSSAPTPEPYADVLASAPEPASPATVTVKPAGPATPTTSCPDSTGAATVGTRNPYANLTAAQTPTAGGGGDGPLDADPTVVLSTATPQQLPHDADPTAPGPDKAPPTLTTHAAPPTLTTHAAPPTLTTHAAPEPTLQASTVCVIDTAMTPVSKTTLAGKPSAATPTKTVYAVDRPTGSPSPAVAYCGVKGEPAGIYFIAEFIEDRAGVPVTEEGCYQFCNSVMEDTKGCQAYRYYPNELGAPRCKLYGMPVSYDVRDIDNNQPGKWYDLACGSPSGRSSAAPSQSQHQGPPAQQKFTGDATKDAGGDAKNDVPSQGPVEKTTDVLGTMAGGDGAAGPDNAPKAGPGAQSGGNGGNGPAPPPTSAGGLGGAVGGVLGGVLGGGLLPSTPLDGLLKKGGLLGIGLGASPLRR